MSICPSQFLLCWPLWGVGVEAQDQWVQQCPGAATTISMCPLSAALVLTTTRDCLTRKSCICKSKHCSARLLWPAEPRTELGTVTTHYSPTSRETISFLWGQSTHQELGLTLTLYNCPHCVQVGLWFLYVQRKILVKKQLAFGKMAKTDYQLPDDPMLCLLLPWRTSVWGVWRRSSIRPARGRPSPGPAPGPRPGATCSPPPRPGPQSGQGRPQSKHRPTLALIALIEHLNLAPNIYNYKLWIIFKYNPFLKTALTGTRTGNLLVK